MLKRGFSNDWIFVHVVVVFVMLSSSTMIGNIQRERKNLTRFRVSVPSIYYLLFCRCRKKISAEFRQNPKQQDSKFLCLPKSEFADFECFEFDF
jgi:hypothetical protein